MKIIENALTFMNLFQKSMLETMRFVEALNNSKFECFDDSIIMIDQMIENIDFKC